MTTEHHDSRDAQASLRCLLARWRVGRRVSRNVYAVTGPEGSPDEDELIGQFDSGQLAREAVHRHNEAHGFR